MTYVHKWLQFIRERFNPLSYLVMIFVFLGAHYSVYLYYFKQPAGNFTVQTLIALLPLVAAIYIFFFMLRLFDEVKDFESDLIHYPNRPLPRGLFKINDVIKLIFVTMAAEIILFSQYGWWALASSALAVGYSWLMYKEFFSRQWLRSHVTTYAVTHTLVAVFISITIFTALTKKPPTELPPNLIYFSIASWLMFNIFEFGRKTFATQEEKAGIDSYSKIFGRSGAVVLAAINAFLGFVLLGFAGGMTVIHIVLLTALLTIIGAIYVIHNSAYMAKFYRSSTVFLFAVTYGIIMYSLNY